MGRISARPQRRDLRRSLTVIAVDTTFWCIRPAGKRTSTLPQKGKIQALAEGTAPWAIPWPCVYEFFSVVTNAKIWKDAASTPEQAWAQIDAWCGSPSVQLLTETGTLLEVLAVCGGTRVRGATVHDARIAALCAAHGVEMLLTRDRDFSLLW